MLPNSLPDPHFSKNAGLSKRSPIFQTHLATFFLLFERILGLKSDFLLLRTLTRKNFDEKDLIP